MKNFLIKHCQKELFINSLLGVRVHLVERDSFPKSGKQEEYEAYLYLPWNGLTGLKKKIASATHAQLLIFIVGPTYTGQCLIFRLALMPRVNSLVPRQMDWIGYYALDRERGGTSLVI